MPEEKNQNLIPISKLAHLTPYSVEYLSLRARQGKLKAIKINNVWHSTTADIKNYLKQQSGIQKAKTPELKEFYKHYEFNSLEKISVRLVSFFEKRFSSKIPALRKPEAFAKPAKQDIWNEILLGESKKVQPRVAPAAEVEPLKKTPSVGKAGAKLAWQLKPILAGLLVSSLATLLIFTPAGAFAKKGFFKAGMALRNSSEILSDAYEKTFFDVGGSFADASLFVAGAISDLADLAGSIELPNLAKSIGNAAFTLGSIFDQAEEGLIQGLQNTGKAFSSFASSTKEAIKDGLASLFPGKEEEGGEKEIVKIVKKEIEPPEPKLSEVGAPTLGDETKKELEGLRSELSQLRASGSGLSVSIPAKLVSKNFITADDLTFAIASFASKGDLENQLGNLNQKILSQIQDLKNQLVEKTQANFNAVALSQKINTLSSPTISSPTISAPTISGRASLESLSVSSDVSISGNLTVSGTQTFSGNQAFNGNLTIGDATSTDILYLNSKLAGSILPTSDNALDIGGAGQRFQTGYFGTSVVVGGGTSTSSANSLLASGAYTLDSAGVLSLNTTNNQNIVTGSGKVGLGTTSPYSLLSISNSASTAANTPLFTIASTTAGTATSTLLTVLASGKVGIGTEGPDDILHVQKNDAAGSFIKLGNTLGRAKMITAAPSGSDSFFQANYSVGNWAFGSHGADENKFKIANAADFDSAVRLTVDGSGNVGIGTTTPNWLLQTAGTRPFFALSDTGASANLKHWTMSSQSGNFYIATSSDALATSTIPALMIDSNGNLGISTTSPYAKLSVNGLLAAANFNADNASATSTLAGGLTVGGTSLVVDYSSGNVGIGTTGPGVKLEVYGSYGTPLINLNAAGANQAPFSLGIDTTASNFGLGIWYNSLQQATFENGGLALGSYFSSNVPSNSLIVSGNVGIGTTSPMSVLSVVGNIAVSGCVQAATSSYNITPENNCADIAEYYPNSEAVEPGDIVALDPVSSLNIRKATSSNLVIGIVSTNPAVLFEGSMSFFGGAPPPAGGAYPVNSKAPLALAGRVPVKVNLEGGEIQVGDRIAVSSAPGIGKKATSSGMTVGIALESFDGTTSLVTPGVDKILVFVNLGYSKLDSAIANGGVMLDGESESAFWGIDESSGQIKFINGLDLNDFGMINVKAIRGSVNPATGGASWSIDSQGKLLVQEVETEKLKVSSEATFGSQEKRIGITIYDEDTGQPYCIKVKNGAMVSAAGACGAETNASEITNNNSQITNNEQVTNDQNTEPGGETSSVEEPVMEPAASDGEPEVSLVPEEPTASTTPGA